MYFTEHARYNDEHMRERTGLRYTTYMIQYSTCLGEGHAYFILHTGYNNYPIKDRRDRSIYRVYMVL